ncbi:MAG: AmmeMemoRadiSam system protein B [Sedimentisphaerales bacterium]|nr:AmmeMemoRadiSam system protein B [Sedimentisphaerales bacterium]MBN2842758.1 AmmeMemoRadiSam system protein B [Sedimentisphaerales bacterium]
MAVRLPIAAGRFYSANPDECRADLKKLLKTYSGPDSLPELITGGIVPHAGWVFSGELCGMLFNEINTRQQVDTFVLFGANHSVNSYSHMVYDVGQWASPLGTIDIDQEYAAALVELADGLLHANCQAHSQEHSLEVLIPFIQYLFPEAKIVPIMVQPLETAVKVGELAAEITSRYADRKIVAIGSTDLTHYGPSYYNTPMGTGPEALAWAKNANDRQMTDLICQMHYDRVISTAQEHKNACGAGAIAATMSYCSKLGKTKGIMLQQTCSAEVFKQKFGKTDMNSVGYAAIAF